MNIISIGRTEDSTIVLNQSNVSRKHAIITQLDSGEIFIEDLNSTNGTFVNGNKITKVKLSNNDIVKIGDSFIQWKEYVQLPIVINDSMKKTVISQPLDNAEILQYEPPLPISQQVLQQKPVIPQQQVIVNNTVKGGGGGFVGSFLGGCSGVVVTVVLIIIVICAIIIYFSAKHH